MQLSVLTSLKNVAVAVTQVKVDVVFLDSISSSRTVYALSWPPLAETACRKGWQPGMSAKASGMQLSAKALAFYEVRSKTNAGYYL